jgi:putative membrane protein (TIGR04086 family)
VVAGAIASGVALVLFSLLVFVLGLPVSYSGVFSMLAFGIGCIVSGIFAGAMKRQNGLSAGVKAALLFMVPVAAIGFVFGEGGAGLLNNVVVAVMCGAVGGVMGVNRHQGF